MAPDRCQVPGQQLHFRVRWYVSTAQEVRSRGSRQRRGWRRIRASKLSGRNPHSPPRCDAWPVCRADRRHIETKRTIPLLPEEKAQFLLPQGAAELENDALSFLRVPSRQESPTGSSYRTYIKICAPYFLQGADPVKDNTSCSAISEPVHVQGLRAVEERLLGAGAPRLDSRS